MREGDSLIGTVPTHIYKWVLKQGVEKVAKYWVLSLLLRAQPVVKQLAFLRPHEPEPQEGWGDSLLLPLEFPRNLVWWDELRLRPAPCSVTLGSVDMENRNPAPLAIWWKGYHLKWKNKKSLAKSSESSGPGLLAVHLHVVLGQAQASLACIFMCLFIVLKGSRPSWCLCWSCHAEQVQHSSPCWCCGNPALSKWSELGCYCDVRSTSKGWFDHGCCSCNRCVLLNCQFCPEEGGFF